MPEHVALLLLIAIVLAGGLIVCSALNQFATVSPCALIVESAEASVSTDGNVVLTVTFQNIEGKAITSAVLEVEGEVIKQAISPPKPGATFLVENPPGVWFPGLRKTGAIKVTFADGSTASTAFAITVAGSAVDRGASP